MQNIPMKKLSENGLKERFLNQAMYFLREKHQQVKRHLYLKNCHFV